MQGYTEHLSHIRKNPVRNWNYFWGLGKSSMYHPGKIMQVGICGGHYGASLQQNSYRGNERERMTLLVPLITELLTEEIQDQARSNYLIYMLIVLFCDCFKVDPRTNTEKAVQCLITQSLNSESLMACTVCNEQVHVEFCFQLTLRFVC